MGDTLSGVLGTKSQYHNDAYQQGNAYDPGFLQQQVERQNAIYGNQNQLADVLKSQMNGAGPAPEQVQYQQNTNDIIKQAQGAVASQRGVNPGLATRMGSNIQAAQQQKAAQQASLLQQNRTLGAQGQLQNLYGQQQGNVTAQQGLYGQSNTAAMQANLSTAHDNQQAAGQVVGGLMQGAGAAAMLLAKGGMVPRKYAPGGMVEGLGAPMANPMAPAPAAAAFAQPAFGGSGMAPQPAAPSLGAATDFGAPMAAPSTAAGPMSMIGKMLSGMGSSIAATPDGKTPPMTAGLASMGKGIGHIAAMSKGGGVMPKAKAGGAVPGAAKVAGDSEANDTVSAKLSPGELVIPRSIATSSDPVGNSARFVAAIMAKKGHRLA